MLSNINLEGILKIYYSRVSSYYVNIVPNIGETLLNGAVSVINDTDIFSIELDDIVMIIDARLFRDGTKGLVLTKEFLFILEPDHDLIEAEVQDENKDTEKRDPHNSAGQFSENRRVWRIALQDINELMVGDTGGYPLLLNNEKIFSLRRFSEPLRFVLESFLCDVISHSKGNPLEIPDSDEFQNILFSQYLKNIKILDARQSAVNLIMFSPLGMVAAAFFTSWHNIFESPHVTLSILIIYLVSLTGISAEWLKWRKLSQKNNFEICPPPLPALIMPPVYLFMRSAVVKRGYKFLLLFFLVLGFSIFMCSRIFVNNLEDSAYRLISNWYMESSLKADVSEDKKNVPVVRHVEYVKKHSGRKIYEIKADLNNGNEVIFLLTIEVNRIAVCPKL
jgi:hypothetical protein